MKGFVRSFRPYVVELDPWRAHFYGAYLAVTSVAFVLSTLATIDSAFDQESYLFTKPALFMVATSALLSCTLKTAWTLMVYYLSAFCFGLLGAVIFLLVEGHGWESFMGVVAAFLTFWSFGGMGGLPMYLPHIFLWLLGAAFRQGIRFADWYLSVSS